MLDKPALGLVSVVFVIRRARDDGSTTRPGVDFWTMLVRQAFFSNCPFVEYLPQLARLPESILCDLIDADGHSSLLQSVLGIPDQVA